MDGTLFRSNDLDTYLRKNIPRLFFKEYYTHLKREKLIEEAWQSYNIHLGTKKSSTESILLATKDTNCPITLKKYLEWKDSKIHQYPIDIGKSEELIDSIKRAQKTYNLFILTNHTSKFTEIALRKLGIESFFDSTHTLTLDKTLFIKPDNRILFSLIDTHGINISESIFIGDRFEVDLAYVDGKCIGSILINNPDKIPETLDHLKFPFCWLKERQPLESSNVRFI